MKSLQLVLILGGARAGKSALALKMAREFEGLHRNSGVAFIATAEPLDDEMRDRIEAHRRERPAHWATIEEPLNLDQAVNLAASARLIVVDCMTLLVSNWSIALEEKRADPATLDGVLDDAISALAERGQYAIFISNEVGLGLVPDTPLGRRFRDLLGRINQRLAAAAASVYFVAAGIPIRLKPPYEP